MSNQKYCAICGWAIHDDKPCRQCGAPSFVERQTIALERIANSLDSICEPMLGGYEMEKPDFNRGYTE